MKIEPGPHGTQLLIVFYFSRLKPDNPTAHVLLSKILRKAMYVLSGKDGH